MKSQHISKQAVSFLNVSAFFNNQLSELFNDSLTKTASVSNCILNRYYTFEFALGPLKSMFYSKNMARINEIFRHCC